MRKTAAALALLLGAFFPGAGLAQAEDSHHHPPGGDALEIQLSPTLEQALAHEMLAIQSAMMDLVPSLAAGDWPAVAKLARQIEGSYLMKQELSAEQMEELHRVLPEGFQELDRSFHRMAGMLAHGADAGQVELVSFSFYKLNETCISCHRRYARHRFPAFAAAPREPEHEH